MKTHHTPGPWQVAPNSNSPYEGNHWAITARSPHVEGKRQTVCELNGPWNEKNYSANAKLIAAAPDMAEALQQALFAIDPTHAAFQTVKQAIAKALPV